MHAPHEGPAIDTVAVVAVAVLQPAIDALHGRPMAWTGDLLQAPQVELAGPQATQACAGSTRCSRAAA